jgi:phosphohistidine phosphatase
MKQLILLRHAKSSWKNPSLTDFARPLNKRGRQNAPLMGRRLAARNCQPQRMLCSPAKRAAKTARLVAAELGYDKRRIDYEPRIYEADAVTLLELVRSLDEAFSDVVLVGHNPGLTDLANLLADAGIDNIVTSGAVGILFPVNTWQEIDIRSGTLQFYDSPKMNAER